MRSQVHRSKQVADLVGAAHDEIVFVPNTTHGLNTILRNIEWRTGDVLLTNEHSLSVPSWTTAHIVGTCRRVTLIALESFMVIYDHPAPFCFAGRIIANRRASGLHAHAWPCMAMHG